MTSQIMLDHAYPCDAGRTGGLSNPCGRANIISLASTLSAIRAMCPNGVSRRASVPGLSQ